MEFSVENFHVIFLVRSPNAEILEICPSNGVISQDGFVPEMRYGSRPCDTIFVHRKITEAIIFTYFFNM